MDARLIRGLSAFGGAFASLLVIGGLLALMGTSDGALSTTFIALGAASFALATQDLLIRWLGSRKVGE